MDDSIRCYIAGLFDGEGSCFSYSHQGTFEVRLQIGLTDRRLLQSIVDDLGFGRITHEHRKAPNKDCFFLRFTTKATKLKFVALIEPFVRLKGPQLAVARRLLAAQGPGRIKMGDHERAIREDCHMTLKSMNARGRNEVA